MLSAEVARAITQAREQRIPVLRHVGVGEGAAVHTARLADPDAFLLLACRRRLRRGRARGRRLR